MKILARIKSTNKNKTTTGLKGGVSGKESAMQETPQLDPWVGEDPEWKDLTVNLVPPLPSVGGEFQAGGGGGGEWEGLDGFWLPHPTPTGSPEPSSW